MTEQEQFIWKVIWATEYSRNRCKAAMATEGANLTIEALRIELKNNPLPRSEVKSTPPPPFPPRQKR